MQWNDHSRLTGQHAFLGASKYHWLNYDAQRLADAYLSFQAKEKGTRLHAFAAECITLRQKLPKSKKTLNAYVNDAIGFRMIPEMVLYYSENCFGTADAISFNDDLLRIHDLKPELFLHIWNSSLFMLLCSAWNTGFDRKIFSLRLASTRMTMFGSKILRMRILTQSSRRFASLIR